MYCPHSTLSRSHTDHISQITVTVSSLSDSPARLYVKIVNQLLFVLGKYKSRKWEKGVLAVQLQTDVQMYVTY